MLRGLLLAALAATGATNSLLLSPPATVGAPGCKQVARPAPKRDGGRKPPKARLDPSKRYDVTLTTNCGSFTIRLNVRLSPRTAASFFALVRSGFFDRTIFHRIVPGFVIQGGDPTGSGTGGPGYTTVDVPLAGRNVVDRIGRLGNPVTERPTEPVVIRKAVVRVR